MKNNFWTVLLASLPPSPLCLLSSPICVLIFVLFVVLCWSHVCHALVLSYSCLVFCVPCWGHQMGVVLGFCHFGLVSFMVLWQSSDMTCPVLIWAHGFECAWAVRSLVCACNRTRKETRKWVWMVSKCLFWLKWLLYLKINNMFIVYLNNASWKMGRHLQARRVSNVWSQPPSQFTRAVEKDGRWKCLWSTGLKMS